MNATRMILYTCGGLMITASVLGALDYNKAVRKGLLDSLYKEPEQKIVLQSGKEKEIDVDDYSRKAIAYEESDSMPPPPPPPPPPSSKKVKKPKQPPPVVVAPEPEVQDEAKPIVQKSKKKIVLKRFGRGPLREVEVDEEEAKPVVDSVWNYR
jgi:hypothetical protein